jgi:hypothetical protein
MKACHCELDPQSHQKPVNDFLGMADQVRHDSIRCYSNHSDLLTALI